jgi:hypothetical protein
MALIQDWICSLLGLKGNEKEDSKKRLEETLREKDKLAKENDQLKKEIGQLKKSGGSKQIEVDVIFGFKKKGGEKLLQGLEKLAGGSLKMREVTEPSKTGGKVSIYVLLSPDDRWEEEFSSVFKMLPSETNFYQHQVLVLLKTVSDSKHLTAVSPGNNSLRHFHGSFQFCINTQVQFLENEHNEKTFKELWKHLTSYE